MTLSVCLLLACVTKVELIDGSFISKDDDHAKIGLPHASKPVSMACERPPSYSHLARTGAINPVPDDLESCPPASYDQLDRTTSWGRSPMDEAGYNVIDRSKGGSFSATYDRLDRGVAAVAVSIFSFFVVSDFLLPMPFFSIKRPYSSADLKDFVSHLYRVPPFHFARCSVC